MAGALADDADLAAPPVDVVQPQSGDLGGPEAEAGQQRQDRPVAPPHRGRLVAGRHHGRDLRTGQRLGQSHQSARAGRRHRVDKPGGDHAVDMQETQQRAQRGHRRR
ncbi:hypothetical protein [Pseudofrankia sp. DC12]|uniref:hypothetical protein n=1 Tax=Pseudofrankia sp. DC12 TaxID=683315 RepID=UPI001E3DDA2E|nr:hypothetical protein [Pseudofrankia sp. DC12]